MTAPSPLNLLFAAISGMLLIFGAVSMVVTVIAFLQRRSSSHPFGSAVSTDPWSVLRTGEYLLMIVFFEFMIVTCGGIIRKASLAPTLDQQATVSIVFQIGLDIAVLWYTALTLKKMNLSWDQAFGFKREPFWKVGLTALVGIGCTILPVLVSSIFIQTLYTYFNWPLEPQLILEILKKVHQPMIIAGFTLLAVIGAPIVEEMVFRGILYPALKRSLGILPALLINSAVFALIHLHLPSLLPLFVLALFFTLAYEWHGNLMVNISMHALFNASSLLLFWMKNFTPTP